MIEITEDIINMGVQAVTFSGGGEPLIYPQLIDVLKKLTQSSVRFAALTNGSYLSGETAELFAYHGTWVRVSIDGWDNESYSKYRGVSHDEFDLVMENIEKFKRLDGSCCLGASVIVDRKNANHVLEIISRLRDLGVNSVKISPCIVSNKSAENNAYHQPVFEVVRKQVLQAKDSMEDHEFEIFDAYHKLDDRFGKQYTWCPYSQVLPVIGADMNIYPCQDKAYNLDNGVIGCVSDISFRDLWSADKDRFFKINPSRDCNHHCVANTKNHMLLEYLNADKEHLGFV